MKNFVWKICHNLLPTKVEFFTKNIVQDPLCPFCLTEEKTNCHILWRCPSSLVVWQEYSRRVQKLSIIELDGRVVKEFLAKLNEGNFMRFLRWLG
jgi:hypothetical protein